MSEQTASNPGAASGSGLGGKRVPGQRSDQSQSKRDAAIKATKEKWGVKEYVDIFPAAIRPLGDLGDSAVVNIRYIANKVPDLEAARLLMRQECVDVSGEPTKLSFRNTSNILAHLKALEAKAAPDEKDKKEKKEEATPKVPASEQPAVETIIPAKSLLVGKTSRLNRLKAPIPSLLHGRSGMPASRFTSHVSLMGGKTNKKELAFGLHAPSAKDVAPFSSKTLATAKKPNPTKRVSFALEEEFDNDTTHSLSPTAGKDMGEPRSGAARLTTDGNGGPTGFNTITSSIKRESVCGEEVHFKKMKFDKESILAELKFRKRISPQTDGHLITGQTPSEADTDIDLDSVPKLLADNVAIEYGFKNAGQKKAAVLTPKPAAYVAARERGFRDEMAAHASLNASLGGRFMGKWKPRELLLRFFQEEIENKPDESSPYTGSVLKRWVAERRDPVDAEKAPASGVTINSQKVAATLKMEAAIQQVSEEFAIEESTTKAEKTHRNVLESPISPKNSPDREESIHSSVARRLFEIHNSKRAKLTGTFSPSKEVRHNRSMSLEHPTLSTKHSTRTDQESSTPKDNMEYNGGEVVDQAEERSTKSTNVDDPLLTPKAHVAPAKGTSAIPCKPNPTLPKLPETLTARIPADRALITSIPGIIKAYINELRAAIPDGQGPNGDLLSMIIVNKFGYFLEHVEKLEKDLISLYYEAEDRNP